MKYFIVVGYTAETKYYLHVKDATGSLRFTTDIHLATIFDEPMLNLLLEEIKDEASYMHIYDLRPAKISIKEYKTIWKS